jgi:CBS-domain-containing membrane protein
MDDMAKFFGGVALFMGGMFFFIIFGTLLGGVAGWTVGLIFGDTILAIASQFGLHGITMFQLGCFLGFIGSFLKTKVTAKVETAKP